MQARISTFFKTHRFALALLVVGIGGIASYAAFVQGSSERIVRMCGETENKPLCYATHIERLLNTEGIPAAFDALAIAYEHDPEFAGTCHALTHELGDAAYQDFNKTGETELTSKASYCGYGFYHGFLDALMIDTNDVAGARSFCSYVGQNVPHPPAPEFAEGSCYHGIGHGITDGTDTALWGDAVAIAKPGLVLCEQVANGNRAWQLRCSSGVFNAIGNMYLDPKYKLDSDPDPYALCRDGGFSRADQESCYSQMNTQAAELAHGDLEAILAYTSTIRDTSLRAIALREAVAYYVQILKREQKNVSDADMTSCVLSSATLSDTCIRGIVGGIYEFGAPGQQHTEALRACAAGTLSDEQRATCFFEVFTLARYYFAGDVAAQVCNDTPVAYRTTCSS